MINLFDLSAGMASTNMLTDRSCRDDSPARRSRQDARRTVDPAKVYVEGKLGASNRSPSSNRTNASPTNMLLTKEISEELELKKKPPSVVARLMGLEDDLPGQAAALHSAKRNLKKSRLNDNLAEPNMPLQPRDRYYSGNTVQDTYRRPKEVVEFKDVYEVSEEPLRTYHLQDQMFSRGMSSRSKTDIRMEIVRQKFMEAKRLATNDKLLNSKELQEALEVLSSNRDLFLKFLEEPNSNFSKQLAELQRMPTQPETKRITVLKPNKTIEIDGRREIRTHRIGDENEHVMSRTHRRSHSAEVTFSQPTRIVVLKPSPGKPSRTMARLTPRAAPSQLTEQIDYYGGSEDDEYLPDALHRRDESLLSSVYSNGYGGDESSSSRSEVDYNCEGGNLSDSESEVVSQVSQHSWDDDKRYSSHCSGSRFRRKSHSTESPVIKEAKKWLSERWASVAYDGTNQEQVQLPRRSSTLGEMLSRREAKKDINGIHSVSSSRPCHTDNELTLQATGISKCREDEGNGPSSLYNLARSKSVPVSSSMFDNITPKDPSSNSEGCKTPKVVTRPDKGKSSFTGKVSSFFFPKSKRQSKEKISLSSASSDERVEVTCLGNMKPKADENVGSNENMSFFEEKDDNSTTQTICYSKDIVSFEVPISSDCPSGDLDGLSGGLKGTREGPSPTSVLDASFEGSNINDSESSRSIACSNGRDALPSTAIESITRSLSWEDMSSPSPSPGSTKLAPLSNVDDDELECVTFVQKILSSAGLDDLQLVMVFSRWYLPDCPLDPRLCDKLVDRKEEAAKSRERRSNQKLLFDCVNMALIEIGEDALLCIGHWSQVRPTEWRETVSQVLGLVPRQMRDWLYGLGKFALNENDDAGTILERIVQEEVEGRGWMKSMRWELDEITMQISLEVLEELVEETVDDLAICSLQQDILMAMSNL